MKTNTDLIFIQEKEIDIIFLDLTSTGAYNNVV